MKTKNKKTIKKRVLNHLGDVSLALLTLSLMAPAPAVKADDPIQVTGQVLTNEGGQQATREVLNAALKMARSKPAMSMATGIVCIACIPVAGAAASPGMCIACGILIAKTFG